MKESVCGKKEKKEDGIDEEICLQEASVLQEEQRFKKKIRKGVRFDVMEDKL
jgi:hypothetical protein